MQELTINDIQHCPICTRAINFEHVAIEHGPKQSIVLIYCDHCSQGWEILYQRNNGIWQKAGVTLAYSTEQPKKLASFLIRLGKALTVAA